MVHHWKTGSTVLKYGASLDDRLHCFRVLKYGPPLEDMICLLASSAATILGQGQSELPAHVEVEVIVAGSKSDEDILFSSAEEVVVVLLCSRLAG